MPSKAIEKDGHASPVEQSPGLTLAVAYERMLLIRRLEETIARLREVGEIAGSVHLSCGQEAVPVGVTSQLANQDVVFGNYRGHGWAVACGAPAEAVIGELAGRAAGSSGGRGGSANFSAPEYGFYGENAIVGAQVPMAVGAALAARYDSSERVAVTVFGDGASNQGAIYEAFNMAGAWRLPVVFILENNRYSELTPIAAMVSEESLYRRGEAFGIPGQQVDGNDPLAVAAATRGAMDRARSGGGPTLIEAMTYRIVGHYIGDAEVYRDKQEVEAAMAEEPLVRARQQLISDGVTEEALSEIDSRIELTITEAERVALAGERADVDRVLDHLYA